MRLVPADLARVATMHRLVCLRWTPGEANGKRRSEAMAATLMSRHGWSEIVNWRGCRLFLNADPNDLRPVALPRETGIVLGALFRDGAPIRSEDLDVETAPSWCADDFESFSQTYWGPFLALIADHARDRLLVVRDAGAARPCFVGSPDDAGVAVVFTHLEDLARVRPLGEIDRNYLSMFLAQPRLVTRRSGLLDVREVLPGEAVALGRDHVERWMAWSPPTANRALASESDEALATRLRTMVEQTVGAYALLDRPIVHRLSGGLDSSVALAALVSADANVRCVCERPLGVEEGDESAAAREVADGLGVDLKVIDYDAAEIDYTGLLSLEPAVRPSAPLLTFADRHFIAALDAAADAMVTSGQGGDQVFFRANALAAMGDAVRDRLAPSALVQVALDISRVARRSVWSVLAAGVEHGLVKSGEAYVRATLSKAASANGSAAAAIEEAMAHPWRRAARKRGPAQMARALFLADLNYYHAPSSLSATFVNAPVLASQPIMSFCSTLPAYVTMRGGRDRALVRRAFKGVLPAIALERQRKGDTSRYFAAVAARNAPFAREILSGGELERLGLRSATSVAGLNEISPEFIAEIWLRQINALRKEQRDTLLAAN